MTSRALVLVGCFACSAPYDAGTPSALLPNARFVCAEARTCVAEPAREYASSESPGRVVETLQRELPDATVTEDGDGVTLFSSGGTTISVFAASASACALRDGERTVVVISRRNGATSPRLTISD